MGCDIHLYTEVKINDQWYCYSKCDVDRNYELFGKMANVRRDYGDDVISEPKGLPDDLSVVVKLEADDWDCDGHSHSWFNQNEIIKLEKYVEEQINQHRKKYPKAPYDYPEKRWGYLGGNSWGNFEVGSCFYPEGIQDIRFVFWFDN